MNILILSEYWYPDEQGGGERSAFQLARELVRDGHAVAVITSLTVAAARDETVEGVRILRCCTTGRPDTLLGNIKRMSVFQRSALRCCREYCRTNHVDIIHLMNTTTIPLAPSLRRSVSCPITAHVNSAVMFCPKGDRMRRGAECTIRCTWNEFVPCYRSAQGLGKMRNASWMRNNPLLWAALFSRYRSYARAWRSIDGWVPIGSGLMQLLELHGLSDRQTLLLPNPLDAKEFLKLPLAIGRTPLRIGYVGPLTEAKGFRVLYEAVQGLPIELHVAGHGSLRALVPAHDSHVIFHGRLNEDQMPRFYDGVDIVVVPSVCAEAFGRVAVEAMASGRPVIVSAIGGLKDIVAGCKGAHVVMPGSIEALRSAINCYIERPQDVARDGRVCRAHIKGKYDAHVLGAAFSSFLFSMKKDTQTV